TAGLSAAAFSLAGVAAAISGEACVVGAAAAGEVGCIAGCGVAAAVLTGSLIVSLAGSGSINLGAAGSGGPIIDFAVPIGGMDAVVAGAFDGAGAAAGGAGIGVGAAAAILALASRRFASAACLPVRVVVATGPIRGAGSVAAGSAAGADAAPSAAGCGADAAGPAEADVAGAEGVVEAAGEGVAGGAELALFCLAIAPVTESRPCSRVVRREYIRSRSLLSVSIADASRLVSFWLSRATDWICCACRDRSAAATSSCRKRNDDWLAKSATMMAPTEAAPQVPSRSIARQSRCS